MRTVADTDSMPGLADLIAERHRLVPDVVVLRERTNVVWVPTAAMVVEVRSPGDETYEKFGFYNARGVEEILVTDMTERVLRLFVRATQAYDQVDTSVVLGADVARIAERLVWPE